ncbi:hypothetical protein AVEN_14533-1 [Araneus ventricosus]|uniref:Uncharacterized protein n=1 Tax=Araneus ventricosus TaxID=182803 RepID=A0A4Y2CFM3_ARAVE|nr:hypothetical protein AVEN_14533-1 [Araneus ventricosus]
MKEDCSHDDLLFVCLCSRRTSERGCIGPVNIAVGHQSSGATYSLRMRLDLTSRTIHEGQRYGESQGHAIVRQRMSNIVAITEAAGYLCRIATHCQTDRYVFSGGSVTAI